MSKINKTFRAFSNMASMTKASRISLIPFLCLLIAVPVLIVGCGKKESGKSASSQPTEKPATPQNAKALIGDTKAIVTWNDVKGATEYNLYLATESGISPQTVKTLKGGMELSSVTSPYTVSSLKNGETYYVVVTAVNSAGESAPSTELALAPQAPLPIPGTPKDVTVVPGLNKATISWSPSDQADHYNVYVASKKDYDPNTDNILNVGRQYQTQSTTFTVEDLEAKQKYYFVVTAANSAGESIASKETLASILQPLGAPQKFQAKSGNKQVVLSWRPVRGSTKYNVYLSSDKNLTQSNYESLKNGKLLAGVKSPYTVSGLKNGTQYYFLVTAERAGGEGPASQTVMSVPDLTVAIPSMPTRLTAVAANGEITVSWDNVKDAASYNLYYAADQSITTKNYSTLPSGQKINNVTNPYTIKNLVNGTHYFVIVTAVNEAGEGRASIFAYATPLGKNVAQAAPPVQPKLEPLDPNLEKLNFKGKPIANQRVSFQTEQWQCVLNKKTGLMWEVKTLDGSLRDKRRTFSWFISAQNPPISDRTNIGQLGSQAGRSAVAKVKAEDICKGDDCNLNNYIASINKQKLCGHSDWRLPTRAELRTLIDRKKSYPETMINSSYFPNSQNSYYWTASQDAYNNQAAWFVNFTSGYEYYDIKSNPLYVRLVRGGIASAK